MSFPLITLAFTIGAALLGLVLLVGTGVLVLTIKLGQELFRHVGSILPLILVLGLVIVTLRASRTPHHRERPPHPPVTHHEVPPGPPPHHVSPETGPDLEEESAAVMRLSEQSDPPSVPTPELNPEFANSDEEKPLFIRERMRDSSGQVRRGRSLKELPDWVRENSLANAPGNPVVILHSQRFATLEEAQRQIEQLTQQKVLERLKVRVPRSRGWSPEIPELETSGLIYKTCVVTWPVQVGEFQESVVQIHWLLRFSPEVEQRMVTAVRKGTVRRRLAGLAGFFGAATLLLAAGSYLILRQATR